MTAVSHRVFVSFVLYVANGAGRAAEFVAEVDAFLAERFEMHELVVVDDASTDGTPREIAALQGRLHGNLVLLELSRRHGPEVALLSGLARAMGDFVFEAELHRADWEPSLLATLYERAASGVDVVAGSNGRTSPSRSRFFRAVNRFSFLDLGEHEETVRVASRRAVNGLLDLREKVRYRRALYAVIGMPRAVVFYAPSRTAPATPTGTRSEGLTHAFDVIVSFSDVGLRLARVLSLVFAGFSLFVLLYATTAYVFFRPYLETGWTTIMLLASTGFTGLFLLLWIFGEYLARILIEVRQRPDYVVRAATTFPGAARRTRSLPLAPGERPPFDDGAAPPPPPPPSLVRDAEVAARSPEEHPQQLG
ncbi:MAG TPA: glycosyltransferase [Actinomycetota bacterium]|nr:glycosyltransferase [Actinomycetota bacterium]